MWAYPLFVCFLIRFFRTLVQCPVARVNLATVLAQAEQHNQATEIFSHIREVIGKIHDEEERTYALIELATGLVQVGYNQQAESIIHAAYEAAKRLATTRVPSSALKSIFHAISDVYVLSSLATIMKQAGQTEQAEYVFNTAREVAEGMPSEERASTLYHLATTMAQAGGYAQARKLADNIQVGFFRESVLRNLTAALAQAGQYDQAREVANEIQIDWFRVSALSDLAVALGHGLQIEQATAILNSVREVANDIQFDLFRVSALSDLASAFIQVQQYVQAYEVIESIQDKKVQTSALRALSVALTETGHYAQAHEIADSIQDEDAQTSALRVLSVALAQAGQNKQSTVIFNNVHEVAEGIESERSRVEALSSLAVALAQAGQNKQSTVIFNNVHEVAEGIESERSRVEALKTLAAALAQAGQSEQSTAVSSIAIEMAGSSFHMYDWFPKFALPNITSLLRAKNMLVSSFEVFGLCSLDRFIQEISTWDLPPIALHHIVRIAGWVRPDWREIYKLLTTEEKD